MGITHRLATWATSTRHTGGVFAWSREPPSRVWCQNVRASCFCANVRAFRTSQLTLSGRVREGVTLSQKYAQALHKQGSLENAIAADRARTRMKTPILHKSKNFHWSLNCLSRFLVGAGIETRACYFFFSSHVSKKYQRQISTLKQ